MKVEIATSRKINDNLLVTDFVEWMSFVRNEFEHDRPDVKHSFRVGVDGSEEVLENGEFVKLSPDGKDTIFGAPGPFTIWEVDSRDTQWDMLDLSGVTGGHLQFCGTNYAFKSS